MELLADRAYKQIKEYILQMVYPPNTPLQEKELQERLGMGRTPIREALIRLQQEGLVQIIPRRGAQVQTLTLGDARDLYHVRSILEPEAVRLAVPHITGAELASFKERFQALLGQSPDEVDTSELIAVDQEFHRIFLDRCRNPYLVEALERIHYRSRLAWAISANDRTGLVKACHTHIQLIEALERHDAEEAAEMMREHVLEMYRAISSFTTAS